MGQKISINPITRIEGHLGIKIEVESRKISEAFSSGEMFRGFEIILKGRDPLDAQQITQRICGVCPVSHGVASILAQEEAYGIQPPKNGRILRNLILGANFIQSHILHFYHLAALDFVDIKAIATYKGSDPFLNHLHQWAKAQTMSDAVSPLAPFLPRYSGKYIQNNELNILAIKHYMEALDMRALAHKAGAIFAGKLPHAATLIPGGVTEKVTAHHIARFRAMIRKLQAFTDNAYLPDVVEVAKAFPEYIGIGKGPGNFLAYGVFPQSDGNSDKLFPSGVLKEGKLNAFDASKITEDIGYSRYDSPSHLPPDKGETKPHPHKEKAYSWLKAPRYGEAVMEVGPLARVLTAYFEGKSEEIRHPVDGLIKGLGITPADLNSVLGRHAARAIECKVVADRCAAWVEELIPEQPTFQDFEIPVEASGVGLTEAPRGALGHWLAISDYKISRYQCVVPTTWNCSPRDDKGTPGPVEQALVGTPIEDSENPIEAARVVRSFDPCIACAVH